MQVRVGAGYDFFMKLQKTMRIKGQKAAAHGSQAARVVIVDSHPVVREGLAYMLRGETDLEVCGQAETPEQALELVATVNPRLVVMGLLLKNGHGLELIRDLHQRFPRALILVVSMHDETVNAERAISAGAAGYINKAEPTDRILDAIRKVLRGEIYLSQKLALQMVAELTGRPPAPPVFATDYLSDRELEILELIGDGFSNRQIAKRLRLDVNTVESYRGRLRAKLQLRDARDLLQYAIRLKRTKTQDRSPAYDLLLPYHYAPAFAETQFRAGFL